MPIPICRGTCQNGRKCSRPTRIDNGLCWQHQTADAPKLQSLAVTTADVHARSATNSAKPILRRILETRVPKTQNTLFIVDAHLIYDEPKWWECLFCLPSKSSQQAHDIHRHITDLYTLPYNILIFGCTFRTLLDHAVSFIEQHPQSTSLWSRLFQEMNDGIGYCLQGNMMRLLNTFSGFMGDAAVIDTSAQLQECMASIAKKTAPVKQKKYEARLLLKKLAIKGEDWAPWLEALEE